MTIDSLAIIQTLKATRGAVAISSALTFLLGCGFFHQTRHDKQKKPFLSSGINLQFARL